MATATQLAPLRANLRALAAKRQALRWCTGWSGLAIAALLVLLGFFALDYFLRLTVLQRVVTWVIAIGVLGWGVRKYLAPFLGQSESEQELALFVERQQQIDSDLIAALQFDSQRTNNWGSSQLQTAVVDYVADFSQGLDVFAGLDRSKFLRRLLWLAVIAVSLLLAGLAFPNYARAFFQRLALGRAHYPTATQIEQLIVNGQTLSLDQLAETYLACAYGQPVKFRVAYAGEPPQSGRVELTGTAANRQLELVPNKQNLYEVELPQLFDNLQFQVSLGDAQTDVAQIMVIPLPVVELQLQLESPDYVRAAGPEATIDPGIRQIAVVEGSRVKLQLNCSNKPLKSVTLTVIGKDSKTKLELTATDATQKNWQYAPGAEQPLGQIIDPVKFELQVVDHDGLSLPQAIEGLVRVKPDRLPSATITVIGQQWLPNAIPELDLRANDDYGLSMLKLRMEILPAAIEQPGGTTNESLGEGILRSATTAPVAAVKQPEPLTIYQFQPPLRGEKSLPFQGKYKLKLETLGLKKGDQLKLVLEATDDRGERASKSAFSDPIFLQITDESGVFAASAEFDERAARVLDNILKVQTGGNP